MRKLLLTLIALLGLGVSGAWAYSIVSVTYAQDSKGNSLVSGGFYRILLPNRGASVALKQNGDYVQAYNGLGILNYMWKVEADANGKALISNPAGGYWKFTDHSEGNSKLKTDGTSSDCTAFQMAWSSSNSKTLNLFDPTVGSYSYDNVTCGTVLSNHSGVGYNMGIYNNIVDGGSIFKFERFYQTLFVCTEDVNGVSVEGTWPVTINGSTSVTEYYTNSDNQITSFATSYSAKYYINGVEKTAEEVKDAINANTGTLTVTVKPQPFVASTIESPVFYAIMISGNANSWFENTNGSVDCASGNSIPAVTENRVPWIWQLIQDGTNGYRIYSVDAEKYLGGRTSTGDAFTLGVIEDANSFIAVYNNATTFKFKDKTNTLWMDRADGQPWAHTSGQQITILPMYKVTFNEGVAVNGGDALTTLYIRGDGSDSFTLPEDKLYSINGGEAIGHVEAETAIASCSSNLTVEVSENLQKNVTYTLKWSDGTTISSVNDVSVYVYSLASDFLPSSMENSFVTLAYDPVEIGESTTEVTVTATWNGPFEISENYANAQWQLVQMHTYKYGDADYEAEKWSWSYKSGDSYKVKPEQVLDFEDVTTNRLFCFVGNPYQGFKIYNAEAGSGRTLYRSGESDELTMAESENIFMLYGSNSNQDISKYFTLKPNGATNYVNFDYNNKKIAGWSDADNGSTCWVVAPGQYYIDYIDGLYLDAPVGAVGTNSYFKTLSNPASAISRVSGLRSTIASSYMYSNMLGSINSELTPIKSCSTITLTDGYYRIVNAYPSWATIAPAIYYKSDAGRMEWSVASNASDNVNSIVYIDATTPSIYSPNAQRYMSSISSTVSGALATDPGTTVFTSLGSAQYNIIVGDGTMHAAGHKSGAGTASNLTSWDGTANTCSAWYIVKVDDIDITLNEVDGVTYGTTYLPFGVTLPEGDVYAYTLTDLGNGFVRPELLGSGKSIPAETAVLLKGTSTTSVEATITDVAAINQSNILNGTYTSMTPGNNLVLGKINDVVGFYKYSSNIKANKAYIPSSDSGVKGLAISWYFTDGIREIGQTGNSQSGNSAIYNLAGQRMGKLQRGVNIVNGKKVLVK